MLFDLKETLMLSSAPKLYPPFRNPSEEFIDAKDNPTNSSEEDGNGVGNANEKRKPETRSAGPFG